MLREISQKFDVRDEADLIAERWGLTREELERTDTAHYAIEALAASSVREVVILGRRGPAQAAFTNNHSLSVKYVGW